MKKKTKRLLLKIVIFVIPTFVSLIGFLITNEPLVIIAGVAISSLCGIIIIIKNELNELGVIKDKNKKDIQ
jgi:hypothetical protein